MLYLILLLVLPLYTAELNEPIANNEPLPMYIVYTYTPHNFQPSIRNVMTLQDFEQMLDIVMDLVSNVVYDFAQNKYYIEFVYH